MHESAPHHPAAELRVFESARGPHLFVADGSRVYDIDEDTARAIRRACSAHDAPAVEPDWWSGLGLWDAPRRIAPAAPPLPAVRSISLNVAQSCNMGCTYCYADEGRFGGPPRTMELAVAEAAIDRLIAESDPGAPLLLGFMGGEPLLNRNAVHHATRYGAAAAARAGREMRFSITTNATLLTAGDAELFAAFPYCVQVSVDGPRERNDAARPMKNGGGSYDRIVRAVELMNQAGRPRSLVARATVTPHGGGDLLETLDHLIGLGFDDVGFAPVVVSPVPDQAFSAAQFDGFLEQMIACGKKALREHAAGRAYPFSNFETALWEIHRGGHRPFACGAGAAYLSANAKGDLFACHRLVDDERFAMGDVFGGSDRAARAAHLERTHVDTLEPCRGCWARYLCGGGCQHEVTRRGRVGCDYIRGWLEFCLSAYAELLAARPEHFLSPEPR
jgi:uncharacterized protein